MAAGTVLAERGARLAIREHAERVAMFEARLGDFGGQVELLMQAQGAAGELFEAWLSSFFVSNA